MPLRHALTLCALITSLLCAGLAKDLPRMLPFLDPAVRAAAPKAVDALRREHGVWLVNADLLSVEPHDGKLCFRWRHRYRSRERIEPSVIIDTCV
jgi:hypothetical protein